MNLYSNDQLSILFKRTNEDFECEDSTRAAILKIVEYLNRNVDRNSDCRISFGMLQSIANINQNDTPTLLKIVAYLTNERTKFLQIKYEFSEDNYFHVLNSEEEEDFLNYEKFYHPENGLLVEDCKSRIYVFFQPSYGEFH
jgi:hypothetical protein